MTKKILIVIGLVLLFGGAIYFAVVNTGRSNNAPIQNTSDTPTVDSNSNTVTFDISGRNYSFTPAELKAKQGDRVIINFKSEMGFHDLVIDEFNIGTQTLNAGETDKISFIADIKGEFEFYCSVANHRQMGMTGKLIVE